MPSDDNQEISYVAPASAPEPEVTATSEDVDTGTQAGGDEPTQDDQEEPRTFTQDELDKIIQKERAKAERAIRRDLERQQQEARRPANGPAPTFEEFNGDAAAFIEALSDWKADQKLVQREHQTHQQTVVASYEERVEKARDTVYPDYDDVVGKPFEEGGPAISDLMADAIRMENNGTDIAYYLGKNVKESVRIAKLSPVQQAIEIGKLAVSLASKAPVKKVSSAPEPIRPISGSAPATLKYGVDDPRSDKTMTHAEWIKARNKAASS